MYLLFISFSEFELTNNSIECLDKISRSIKAPMNRTALFHQVRPLRVCHQQGHIIAPVSLLELVKISCNYCNTCLSSDNHLLISLCMRNHG